MHTPIWGYACVYPKWPGLHQYSHTDRGTQHGGDRGVWQPPSEYSTGGGSKSNRLTETSNKPVRGASQGVYGATRRGALGDPPTCGDSAPPMWPALLLPLATVVFGNY